MKKFLDYSQQSQAPCFKIATTKSEGTGVTFTVKPF